MFGQMKAQPVVRVTPITPLGEEVNAGVTSNGWDPSSSIDEVSSGRSTSCSCLRGFPADLEVPAPQCF